MDPAVPNFPKNAFSVLKSNLFFFFNQNISFPVVFLNRQRFSRAER